MTLIAEIHNYKYPNENNKISDYISEIQKRIQQHPISDLVDNEGHQYVDLVLEGGGVLGIALVGYTYALEQAGIRFLNIAGTSAGAINALFLASLGQSHEPKSEKLLAVLDSMNMNKFVDGGLLAKALVKNIQQQDNFWVAMLPKIIGLGLIGKFSKTQLGINSGEAFKQWLEDNIGRDVNTLSLLKKLKNKENLLKIRENSDRKTLEQDKKRLEQDFQQNELAIIATDVTTESKIIFPRMATLYWDNPLKTHPLHYVRASMSIPLFFKPCIIPNIPIGRERCWEKLTGFKGKAPETAYLVDGGIVSNFPIDVFHQREFIPLCPTFGAKLDVDRQQAKDVDSISHYLSALFDSARHTADYSFLHQNEDYQHLITYINTAESNEYKFHWLDFDMDDHKKAALFALGVKAAHNFIIEKQYTYQQNDLDNHPDSIKTGFNWSAYKKIREDFRITLTDKQKQKLQEIKQCSIQSLL
ncbi:MAG: patatin-like phospholipase family protein [Acinetobacter sp.]